MLLGRHPGFTLPRLNFPYAELHLSDLHLACHCLPGFWDLLFSFPGISLHFGSFIPYLSTFSGWCQYGNTSSRMVTEVKHLELKQFSDGWPPSGECWVERVSRVLYFQRRNVVEKKTDFKGLKCQRLMSIWKYQFSCDHWSQASWAQPEPLKCKTCFCLAWHNYKYSESGMSQHCAWTE